MTIVVLQAPQDGLHHPHHGGATKKPLLPNCVFEDHRSCSLRHYLCIALICLTTASASADTLLCKDGKKVTGDVTLIGSIYVVKTSTGQTIVPVSTVKQWIKSDGSSTPDTPAVTSKPPTTGPAASTTRPGRDNTGANNTGGSSTSTPPKPKKVTRYAAAFPISPELLITAAAPLDNVSEIHIQASDGTSMTATLVKKDADTGLALLKVQNPLKAFYSIDTTFAGGDIQCPAFCELDLFDTRSQVLTGEAKTDGAWTLKLSKAPSFAGSPLLIDGKVVGVELARASTEADSVPVATLEQVKQLSGDLSSLGSHATPQPTAGVYQVIISAEAK